MPFFYAIAPRLSMWCNADASVCRLNGEAQMSHNVRKFAAFVSSILVCFALHSVAADQQTVLVVAQDGSQIYYHQNGEPIDSEEVPKGTELTIESRSGERCFVTYKGKPAYIRRQLLATKQEFLDAQQKATQQQVVLPAESRASTQQQVAATSTTNAVTKYDARADAIHSVIQNLKARADAAIESGHYHFIGAMFTSFDGDYAEETAAERKQLAIEYDEKAGIAEASKLEETRRFETEQRAKGLMQYEGRWMTTNEVSQAEAKRKEEQARQDEQARLDAAERTPDKEALSKISVSFGWQDVWMNGGKKLVVWIKNSSQFRFSGNVNVTGKSVIDETVDWDVIYLDDERGLPGNGERPAILWFKNPEFISTFEYKVSGSFK